MFDKTGAGTLDEFRGFSSRVKALGLDLQSFA